MSNAKTFTRVRAIASTARRIFVFFFCAATSLSVGCTISAAGKERIALRNNNLKRTIGVWKNSEARRPENLRWTLGKIRASIQEDHARTKTIPERLRNWVQEDAVDFRDKQPEIRRKFKEIMQGNPEAIQPTAERMFF